MQRKKICKQIDFIHAHIVRKHFCSPNLQQVCLAFKCIRTSKWRSPYFDGMEARYCKGWRKLLHPPRQIIIGKILHHHQQQVKCGNFLGNFSLYLYEWSLKPRESTVAVSPSYIHFNSVSHWHGKVGAQSSVSTKYVDKKTDYYWDSQGRNYCILKQGHKNVLGSRLKCVKI